MTTIFPQFGRSQVNIAATTDNHGKTETFAHLIAAIKSQKSQLFPNQDDNTENIIFFGGDHYMDPTQKGLMTNPGMVLGDIQTKGLIALANALRSIANKLYQFWVTGDHDLDAGDKYWVNNFSNIRQSTQSAKSFVFSLLTNADLDNSTALDGKRDGWVNSHIVESLNTSGHTDHTLVLGITTPGMERYLYPGAIDGLNIDHKPEWEQKKVDKTIERLNKVIADFKAKHPKGGITLLSHMDKDKTVQVLKSLSSPDYMPAIVYNAHDHIDAAEISTIQGKDVLIVQTGQNNQKLDSATLHYDDDGNVKAVNMDDYRKVDVDTSDDSIGNEFATYLKEATKEDIKPRYLIVDSSGENIELNNATARVGHSPFCNWITDSLLEGTRKLSGDDSIQLLPLSTSAIRREYKHGEGFNNLSSLGILAGHIQPLSEMYVGDITGDDIAKIIIDHMTFHDRGGEEKRHRNPLIQWANLKMDTKALLAYMKEHPQIPGYGDEAYWQVGSVNYPEDTLNFFKKHIQIKQPNGSCMPLSGEETYRVAMPNYFFIKNRVRTLKHDIANKFQPIKTDEGQAITLTDALKEGMHQSPKNNNGLYEFDMSNYNDIRV